MIERFHRLSLRAKAFVVAALLLAVSGVLMGAVRLGRRGPGVLTMALQRGEFLDSIQFHGEMKALKSVSVSAPPEAGELQIIKVVSEGTTVKPGDMVVQFDGTKTQQELAQYRSALKSAEAEIAQAKAKARLDEEKDKTAVLRARYEVEGARLEATKQEILSRIEGEENKLKLSDSEQKLHEAEAKQKSNENANQAAIEGKRQASEKSKYDVSRAEHALSQMILHAPSAGNISMVQHFTNTGMSVFRSGDRVWPGAPIAELPDPSSLRISARVDETERGRLALNQPVTVQLNAIPDRQFTGHIQRISAIASMDFSNGWPFTRNFTLEIVLDQTDPRFKPGITGDVTVIIDKVADALSIPAQALFQKSGQNVVYVWQGGRFEERALEVVRRSGDKILVSKGVSAGEQVALKDPTTKE